MLLFEAKNNIKNRMVGIYESMIGNPIKQLNADLISIKCIEAQMRLAELLNDIAPDLTSESHKNDTYSIQLVYEMLSTIRFDAKFDDDGNLITEEEEP